MTETRTAVVGALIVALGSVSMSLYTPAMPALVEAFQTTPATVKLTLTVYFGGFSFAQLVCGPLSEALGRRPPGLGFFSVYARQRGSGGLSRDRVGRGLSHAARQRCCSLGCDLA